MKRLGLASFLLVSCFVTMGCCYRPAYVNSQNGMAYGGGWEPCCGGPLDPFGFWCMVSYGYCGYGWNGYPYMGSPYGYPVSSGLAAPNYGMPPYGGPMWGGYGVSPHVDPCGGACPMDPCQGDCTMPMPSTTTMTMPGAAVAPCGNGAPCHAQPAPSGTLSPVPDPMNGQQTNPQTTTGGAATFVVPPLGSPQVQQAAQQPIYQAF